MRQTILSILVLIISLPLSAQSDKAYLRQVRKKRKKIHREFKNPDESPLREAARDFKGLAYWPANSAYRVEATFSPAEGAEAFQIETSNPEIQKPYIAYGYLDFELEGKSLRLTVFRSLKLAGLPQYKDYLFLPFTDLTTGTDTYGGGRYLDMRIPPEGAPWIIDFNLCYNPYCAYGDGWSCPIPPQENFLDTRIEAGVKDYADHP